LSAAELPVEDVITAVFSEFKGTGEPAVSP
jgi:hypothetical protein